MRSIVRGAGLILVGCAALRGAAAEEIPTVHVPAEFATIQEAVDSIGSYGVVAVDAGTYGPFTVDRARKVTIIGTTDAVIDGGSEPAITVIDGSQIVVEGFTVVSSDVGVSLVRGYDVTVQDVIVQSAGSDGIRADTVTDVTITGNRVETAGGTAISVTATTSEILDPVTVTSNTVLAAGGDGIFVHNIGDGADVVVTDNVVTDVGGRGIRTECGMTLDLSRNDVRSTGDAAVSVDRVYDRVSVTENTVLDAGGAGIDVQGTPNVDVLDNSIVGTGADGVTVSSNDVEIDRNSVTGAGDAGIRVLHSDDRNNPYYGVPDAEASIGDNVVTQPAGTGIVLDHARPIDVVGNTVTEPGVHGIVLDGTRGVRVMDNDVAGAGSCGFRLAGGAQGNVLTGNTAEDCTRGLWARGVAKKNRIARSNDFGRRRARR
jgi:parallel beta-helix repeat protein